MSLVTGIFFLVLLLNQRWSPLLRLQASHCSTFRIMCDVPSIDVVCSDSVECFPGTVSRFFLKLIIIIIIIIMSLWNFGFSREDHRLGVFENRVLRRIFVLETKYAKEELESEFNNCPTRCDLLSLLRFCRQLYVFLVLTPIIRNLYSCNYSFWLTNEYLPYDTRGSVPTQKQERMAVNPVNQYQKL